MGLKTLPLRETSALLLSVRHNLNAICACSSVWQGVILPLASHREFAGGVEPLLLKGSAVTMSRVWLLS